MTDFKTARDQDRGKGAVEQNEREQPGNTSLPGQLGHRDQDPLRRHRHRQSRSESNQLLSLVLILVAKVEAEGGMLTRAVDLDRQFCLTILAKEGIECF